MKIGIISFSAAGESLAVKLSSGLAERLEGAEIVTACKSKYAQEPLEGSHVKWTGERFADSDGLIFIGAAGIAVRAIAPFLKDKKTDPAVVVMDDRGRFAISLLSGHLGGANTLAETAAEITGAVPVVTTATDNRGKLAPDIFAQKNNCQIGSFVAAKDMAAALLNGEEIGFVSDFEIDAGSDIPEYIRVISADGLGDLSHSPDVPEMGIVISSCARERLDFKRTLRLIPQCAYLGVGARRGTPAEKINEAVSKALAEADLDMRAVSCVATIDLKKDEEGLIEFCRENHLNLQTFTAEELSAAEGEFCSSDFVKKTTGVDNVCERSAMLAASQDETNKLNYEGEAPALIVPKQKGEGVTCAVAVKKWRIRFE